MRRSWRTRITLLIVPLALAALLGALYSAVIGAGPPPPLSTPPPPVLPPQEKPKPLTFEEERQMRAKANQEGTGQSITVSGPETAGSRIHISRRTIQLPPDAFVNAYVVSILCPPDVSCPETPYYSIKRGNSSIGISARFGIIFSETIASGEEGAFDFLKETLR